MMHESATPTQVQRPVQRALAFARLSAAVDALSSAIAGFALLAGARAFMFIALLGWREPVLGGAGLMLLALVGWLRWQCGGTAAPRAAADRRLPVKRGSRPDDSTAAARRDRPPRCAEARNVACYNRSSHCDSTRSIAAVERQSFGHVQLRA